MNLATKLMASAALIGFTMPVASAADLPPIYETPIYQDVPEVQPVEIGSGWYLRGDVSYDFQSDVDVNGSGYRPDFADGFELNGAGSFGVGFGYQFTDYFRGDLTARYWSADLDGGDRIGACFDSATASGGAGGQAFCDSTSGASATGLELMANAYADLGTFVGFTPYVGAGAGAVKVKYDDVNVSDGCTLAGAACVGSFYNSEGAYDGGSSWRFAYSLMAGVSYDISRNLKVDLGYRFLDVDGGDAYSYSGDVAANGQLGLSAEDDGFQRHSVQAAIRYLLW
ncbi:putative outer surface protein [Aurantimonas manganoxydans SI85-9A1]|uniref:Putative outer surface protein n=1 Tax=Aurantimonas manganoxydans (strain ATCC BAA-1229 / DSM 21871 / SI85-9A1) TaxID=287752 RepID=Q1YJV5_AURMS|nr:outer membrane beta-barrel protein [Aurantimonas manganoxydans]EAS50768.1 putative outer surface protein [Aurantimonas manganoxydans SI85-9A1]